MQRIHGSCVLLSGVGVLLRGRSGSGKSDLALRLIDGGARLVADDHVEVEALDGGLIARAPDRLFGMLEVRGIGILRVPAEPSAPLRLVVDLASDPAEVERLPEEETVTLAGVPIRRLTLQPFHSSTPAKLRLAAAALANGRLKPVPDPS